MDELKIPEDLREAHANYSNPLRCGLDNSVVVALIERIADDEDAVVTLARQHAQSGETIARLKAVLDMAVDRLGGTVEGAPTQPLNFLQRIDELVRKEQEAQKLADLLCPPHASMDSNGNLKPFDNCIACIRNERDEALEALRAYQKLDDAHANCDECEGLEQPDTCAKCFPLADAARLKMRAVLA